MSTKHVYLKIFFGISLTSLILLHLLRHCFKRITHLDCLNIDLAEIISNFASASLELIILKLKNKVGFSFVFNGQPHFSFADSQECETCASACAVLRFMTT